MRFWRRHTTPPACADCRAGLDHCHGTLVLHADGTVDCDDIATCGGDPAGHELWVSCVELDCGCTGEEHDLLLAA